VEHQKVAQEAIGQCVPAAVAGGVACSNDLDALESNPRGVLRPPKPTELKNLSEERDGGLGPIRVSCRQVHFVAKQHETARWTTGAHDEAGVGAGDL
jgi:hypothetical protein